jgi:hypothetical protein
MFLAAQAYHNLWPALKALPSLVADLYNRNCFEDNERPVKKEASRL